MKATDLMIGDWVRCTDPKPFRIEQIDGVEEQCYGDDGFYVDTADLQSIPLTAEILGKNGFVHRQSVTWGDVFTYTYAIVQKDKVLQYEQHFNLSPNPYDGSGFYWIPEMSAVSALRVVYVHELQHLLRLCGIEKDIIEL